MSRLFLSALLALAAVPAWAQADTAATASTKAPDIVVSGETPDQTRSFIGSMTSTYGGRQLARWNAPICPATMGFSPAQGTFLVHHIMKVAAGGGVPVATGKCQVNVLVLSVPEADRFTKLFVDQHRSLGRRTGMGRVELAPRHEIDTLLQPRPVRWFHASMTAAADGSGSLDGTNISRLGSRIKMVTRENATLSFMIVDPDRIVGATWDQLADYLAMVALSRPRLGDQFPGTSILSLFTPEGPSAAAPTSLTDQDETFLQALYATSPDQSASAQRANIAARMRNPPKAAVGTP